MKPIYLCGPINGRSDAECVNWREAAKNMLTVIGTLDPMRHDYRGRESEPGTAVEIVSADILDIQASGGLLVMFDKPSVGTAMEIRIASAEFGLPVWVVNTSGSVLSPWLLYHATDVFTSLADACATITEAALNGGE